MPSLFDPIDLRSLTLPNRVVVSPMCEYSSVDGFANDWHLVHLGSRAVGGAGLVITEATAVSADGRISPQDLGLWKDEHIAPLRRITEFIHSQGSTAGIQLAHAGRKASTAAPWLGEGEVTPPNGGWEPVGPTTERFIDSYPQPRALTVPEINSIVRDFEAAAFRSREAGFDVVEIHAAHGYLLHQFLSPLVNTRTDEYGGSFENRVRLTIDIADAVRRAWPEGLPVLVRISATDWVDVGRDPRSGPGAWDLDQSVELARRLKAIGIDVIDCSSGGAVPNVKIPVAPGYQVPFAERIRRDAGIATGAVGLITTAAEADELVRTGKADLVLLARQMLRDPYFALHAAQELGVQAPWPVQYLRAAPRGTSPRSAS